MTEPREFTLEEAIDLLPTVRAITDEIIEVRPRLVAGTQALQGGEGSRADVKADEALLADLLDQLGQLGIEVKGWAPVLVDFPATIDNQPVLLCWLEGETSLGWYHHRDHGFAGRRPIASL